MTKIKAAMTALVKPSTDMSNVLKDLGVQSGAELVDKYGSLQAALEAVRKETDGSAEAMNKLFPNIRAAQGAMGLTGSRAKVAAKHLQEVADSTGAADDAFKEQSKSLAVQWQELKARLSVLAVEIGNKLIPALTDAVEWINEGGLGRAFEDVKPFLDSFVGGVKVLVEGFAALPGPLKVATAAVVAFGLACLTANPMVAILVAAIAAIGAGIEVGKDAFRSIHNAVTLHLVGASRDVENFGAQIGQMGNLVTAGVAKATGGFKHFEAQVGHTMADVGRSAAQSINALVGVFFKVGKKMGEAIVDGIKSTGQAAKDAARQIAGDAGNDARSQSPKWAQAGNTLGRALAQGIGSQAGATSTAASVIAIAAAARTRAAIGSFQAAGAAMGNALAAGLRSAIGGVAAAANALAAAAARANNHRAAGGSVSAGHSYIVGEQGQELFVPKTDGYIVPNHALPAFGGIAGAARGGTHRFVIENWQTGAGYFREIADGAVDNARNFEGQRGRMRRT
jgi:hypothetical protein